MDEDTEGVQDHYSHKRMQVYGCWIHLTGVQYTRRKCAARIKDA